MSKPVNAYTKEGVFVQRFPSTAKAARWCYNKGKCLTLGSGARSHIGEVANGKRKSAYGYLWKYE